MCFLPKCIQTFPTTEEDSLLHTFCTDKERCKERLSNLSLPELQLEREPQGCRCVSYTGDTAWRPVFTLVADVVIVLRDGHGQYISSIAHQHRVNVFERLICGCVLGKIV